jgi:putative two-component system response regulator
MQTYVDEWTDELRDAPTFEELRAITMTHARRIAAADGATFVVRDGRFCFYVDEDAIGPLWRGQRFPLDECITGWAMIHNDVAFVPHPFSDDRIPHAAYRPTFIKSLVAVPIGDDVPVGAIGVYWATAAQLLPEAALAELRRLAVDAGRAIVRLGLDQAPWAPNFALPDAGLPASIS